MRRTGSRLIPPALPPARTLVALKGVGNAARGRSMQMVQVQVAVVASFNARAQAKTRPASCHPTEPSLSLERTLQTWSLDSDPLTPTTYPLKKPPDPPKIPQSLSHGHDSSVQPVAPAQLGENQERIEEEMDVFTHRHHESPARTRRAQRAER